MIDRLREFQDETFRTSDETLAVVRIIYFFFALSPGVVKPLGWAAQLPDWVRDPPPGLPTMMGPVPPSPVLSVLVVAIMLAAVAGLVGYRTRVASLSFSVLMVFHHAIEYSFGKIDHDLLAVLTPAILASTGWGSAFSVDAVLASRSTAQPTTSMRPDRSLANARALAVLYTIWAAAFFTAGMAKVQGGWLSPSSQMAGRWVRYYQVVDPSGAIAARPFLALPTVLLELIDWATILIEVTPLMALLLPRLAKRLPLAAVGFHVGVVLAMGINFGVLLVVYLPLIAAPEAGGRFRRLAARQSMPRWLATAAVSGILWRFAVHPGVDALGAETGWRVAAPRLVHFAILLVVVLWAVLDRGIGVDGADRSAHRIAMRSSEASSRTKRVGDPSTDSGSVSTTATASSASVR